MFRHLCLSVSVLLLFLIVTSVHAARPGYYIGGQVGWGSVHDTGVSEGDMGYMINQALGYGSFTMTSFDGTTSDTGFVWRVFGGYQIGYNWGMEIGWSQYPRLPIYATAAGIDNVTGLPFVVTTETGLFKTTVFDAVGKAIYPFPFFCPMNVYAKLGGAWLTGRSNPQVIVAETGISALGENLVIVNRLFPTASIGFSADLRDDISLDLSYTHVQKVGKSPHFGSLDNVMLGFLLHFG